MDQAAGEQVVPLQTVSLCFLGAYMIVGVQLLAVAGALAVVGLWYLSRRNRGRRSQPSSPGPKEATGVTTFLRSRIRRDSNE